MMTVLTIKYGTAKYYEYVAVRGWGGRSDLNVLVNMLTTPNAANELCAVIVIVTFSSS